MANLIDITLIKPHSVLGRMQAKDAMCAVHKGCADDLIARKIAKKTTAKNEPNKGAKTSGGGE